MTQEIKKIWISSEERYPVYDFEIHENYGGKEVEIEQSLLERLQAAIEEFNECQEILSNLHET